MEKKLPHSNFSFDDEIKNKLQEYESTPSPHMWSRIESELHPSDSKPKGIFWLQNKMLLTGLGILLFVGFSSTGACYVIKNMLHEYQIEKESTSTKAPTNFELISNINKHHIASPNKNAEILTSESNSTVNKVTNYLESIIPMVKKNLHSDDATTQSQQITNSTKANTNQTREIEELKIHNVNSSLFSLIKMNVQQLNNLTTVSSISPTLKEEGEVIFASNDYHLKGIYLGPEMGTSASFATNNYKMSNPVLGIKIGYHPSIATKIGLVIGYNINNKIALETRISYLFGTHRFDSYKYDAKASGNLKLSYIEIPLNIKYKFNQLSKKSHLVRSVNISAGLQYAYLTTAKLSLPTKVSKQGSNPVSNAHDYISNHQLGINAGVDYDLFVSKNIYWTIGLDGSVMGDMANKNVTTSPNIAIGIHTGIRFFSGGHTKGKN